MSILFAGCINQPNSDKNNNLDLTSTPAIFLDDENHLSIIWMSYDEDLNTRKDIEINYPRYISIIDNDGNYIIKSKEIKEYPIVFLYYNFIKDLEGNYHFISLKAKESKEVAIFYTKFDTNLNQLIPEKKLTTYSRNIGFPKLAIDSNNEISIIWEQPFDEGEIYFNKIDNNGNDLINTIDLSKDQNNVDTEPFVIVDPNNVIHVKWYKKGIGDYYMKLSDSGQTLVHPTPIDQVTEIPGYPIVKNELGNLLYLGEMEYLGEMGVVDSKNNIHIFSQIHEIRNDEVVNEFVYNKLNPNGTKLIENSTLYSKYMSDHKVEIDSLDNIHIVWKESNYIYYSKLDDNGNKLIEKMKIV